MDEMKRGQFTMYRSYVEAAELMTSANAGKFLLALCRYALDGEEPGSLPKEAASAFKLVRPLLEKGRKKAAAGKAGGECRPSENSKTAEATQRNEAKKPAKKAVDMPDLSWASTRIQEAINQWITYKKEKGQGYKPTGLKSLVAQIRNKVETHGEVAVIQIIEQSMAANWQGIIWDKIGGSQNGPTTGNIFNEMRRDGA